MVAVLVCGGSGYLGQFLVQHLAASGHAVAYTYATRELPPGALGADVISVQAEMVTGKGLDAALSCLSQPLDVVVNTIAISQLLEALVTARNASGREPLLVHLSTDQVYNGTQPMSSEDTAAAPVNAYGRSKLAAEAAVAAAWPRHVILRSSLIYGPLPPVSIGRQPFLQFVRERLQQGTSTSFFEDEVRCPVFVLDICRTVEQLARQHAQPLSHHILNMGGPQRLSRVDIARAVAQHIGLSEASIVPVASASVKRGYCSPLDISMNSTRLSAQLQLQTTPLKAALEQIWPLSV